MKGLYRLVGMGLLLVAVAVAVSACQVGPLRIVNGSGNLQTERRAVSDFNEVEVRGDGLLVIEQGTTEALTIEAEDNILPLLTADVRGGRLILGKEEDTTLRATKPIRYRLTVRDLHTIRVSGAAGVEAAKFQAERLTIEISGSGDIAYIGSPQVSQKVSGSGEIKQQAER